MASGGSASTKLIETPGPARRHCGDHARHDRRRGRGEGGDAHTPRAEPPELGEVARGGVERGRHRRGVPREHPAGFGEPHAASDPLDDRHPGAPFQPAQLLAHGGLAVTERRAAAVIDPVSAIAFTTRRACASRSFVGIRHPDT